MTKETSFVFDKEKKKYVRTEYIKKPVRNIENDNKVIQMIENLDKDIENKDYIPEQIKWRKSILEEAKRRKLEALRKGSSLLPVGRMIKHRYTIGLEREREKYGLSKKELKNNYYTLMKNYLFYKEKAKRSDNIEKKKLYKKKANTFHNRAKKLLIENEF